MAAVWPVLHSCHAVDLDTWHMLLAGGDGESLRSTKRGVPMANLQDSANILIIHEKEIHLHYLICSLQILAMLPVGMSSPIHIRKLLSTCFEVSALQQFLGPKISSGRLKTSGALTVCLANLSAAEETFINRTWNSWIKLNILINWNSCHWQHLYLKLPLAATKVTSKRPCSQLQECQNLKILVTHPVKLTAGIWKSPILERNHNRFMVRIIYEYDVW